MAQELTPKLQQLLQEVQRQMQMLETPLTIFLTPNTLVYHPFVNTLSYCLLEDFNQLNTSHFKDITYPTNFKYLSYTLSLCH